MAAFRRRLLRDTVVARWVVSTPGGSSSWPIEKVDMPGYVASPANAASESALRPGAPRRPPDAVRTPGRPAAAGDHGHHAHSTSSTAASPTATSPYAMPTGRAVGETINFSVTGAINSRLASLRSTRISPSPVRSESAHDQRRRRLAGAEHHAARWASAASRSPAATPIAAAACAKLPRNTTLTGVAIQGNTATATIDPVNVGCGGRGVEHGALDVDEQHDLWQSGREQRRRRCVEQRLRSPSPEHRQRKLSTLSGGGISSEGGTAAFRTARSRVTRCLILVAAAGS